MTEITRRGFLGSTSAAGLVPILGANRPVAAVSKWHCLYLDGSLQAIGDPAAWAVNYVAEPLFSPARERLVRCDPRKDWLRIVRVVLRRCGPAIQALVHKPDARQWDVLYWTRYQLVHSRLRERYRNAVVRLHRMKTVTTIRSPGIVYGIGCPLPEGFPTKQWSSKRWESHWQSYAGDDEYAPYSGAPLTSKPQALTWGELKGFWRKYPRTCPVCRREPSIYLRQFVRCGMSATLWGRFVCPVCKREFDDSNVQSSDLYRIVAHRPDRPLAFTAS